MYGETGMSLAPVRPRRRPSLTPMIDVVFLLLIFFMLAARFGMDQSLPLRAGGTSADYSGPPRLIEAGMDDLRLNGVALQDDALLAALEPLMSQPDDMVVLSADAANTQRLVDLIGLLGAAGIINVVLVE